MTNVPRPVNRLRPRRRRSADLEAIWRLAERADGLAVILEAVHKPAEAVAARNIADAIRQAVG